MTDWAIRALDLQQQSLDRLEGKVDAIAKCQQQTKLEITRLKVKASIWGAVSGLILSGIVGGFVTLVLR